MMNITDINGRVIEVTNLDLAIMQADDYLHYRFTEPEPKHHLIYDYWEDVYQKLLALQIRLNDLNNE